jgi:hypothetical protein
MLRFFGYNPLQYIPYRTYNRIVKENSENTGDFNGESSQKTASSTQLICQDLGYVKFLSSEEKQVQGGSFQQWIPILWR